MEKDVAINKIKEIIRLHAEAVKNIVSKEEHTEIKLLEIVVDDLSKSKLKGNKKKTERSVYLGVCMRGSNKGGMGKNMKTCSDNFKSMSSEEKKKYTPKET